jgi:LPXTG-motif cell wall-anchored protein
MSRDDRSTGTFVRGLTIGAIIGAILAGSSFWSRRRRRSDRAPR